jgi:hypothetical protein
MELLRMLPKSTLPAIPARPPLKTLLLDLGTDTGWALLQEEILVSSGTLCLATDEELELQRREGRERTLDIRFARLYGFITEHVRNGVGRVVFEDVEFVSTRMQTQLWASLRTAIWAAALMHPELRVFGLPVATLKEFAAGDGHAQKLQMAQALASRRPECYRLLPDGRLLTPDGHLADHNEIDAIWLAYYTQAVDRGEQDFLPVYQRKQREAADRKEKKALRRQKAKAKKDAARTEAKLRKEAIRDTLRSMDRCCGVFRKLERRRATCPKCGSRVAMPKLQLASYVLGEPVAAAAIHPAGSGSLGSPDRSDASLSVLPAPGISGAGVQNTPLQP